jgi:glycosyltransferase involved in cell wall biosynthesis
MMEQVFDDMDLLVVPSIWHETFSLVALEALSYGTCVLVSDKVGAKDIVSRYSPEFVFKSKQSLHDIIMELLVNRDRVSQYNKTIVSSSWVWSMKKHAKDIVDEIYR